MRDPLPRPLVRVLVVDDEPDQLHSTCRSLLVCGYAPLAMDSAQVALALIQRSSSVCDLLLTDLMLPGLSGVALCRQVHALRPGLPVVLMTGSANAQLARRLAALGAASLPKPFTPDELDATIRGALEENRP